MPQTHSELRVGAVSVLSVVLGDLAHAAASGAAPDLRSHLVSFMVLGLVLHPLGRSRRGLLATFANLALGQAVVHEIASLMAHRQEPVGFHAGLMTQAHGSSPSPGMLLLHILVVGLCALWLTRGEQVIVDLLKLLSARLFTFPFLAEPIVPAHRTSRWTFGPLVAVVLPSGVGTTWAHRGPPSI